jgi:hypothetical protein
MKTYLIVATVLAMVGLLVGTYNAGYSQGKTRIRAVYERAALEHRHRENALLLLLETAKKERKVVYRERVKLAKDTQDVCLDRPVPGSITRLLHDARRAETQPVADP